MAEFDIFKHQLVPIHTILKEKEKAELLKKYNIKVYQLPKLSIKDPAIKQIKKNSKEGDELPVNAGDVVEITRKSETAGKSVYYRVIVDE
ncbi:MAG: DNA-directed RNA polymerase subunit H [Candidatus Nanoarchaeia archaeon]|nr:DNA-directed RNA polymerase subunit H [Candidatus Nanoarchaeia archaeon]